MKLFLMIVFVFSSDCFASTTSNLTLKGQVQEIVDILVVPEAIASTLPLDISQNGTKVATVTEKSNVAQGYNVKMVSLNLGNLKRTDGSELFSYSITYNNLPVDLVNGETYSYHNIETVHADRDIKIFYNSISTEDMVAGEYSDTITFTISVN